MRSACPRLPAPALSSLWRGAGSGVRCLQRFCTVPSVVQPTAQQLLCHSSPARPPGTASPFKTESRGDPQHKRWLIKERKPPGRRWPESPAVQEKRATCKGQERYTQLAAEARAGRLCHTDCHRCVTFLITINYNNHRAEEGIAVTLTGMTLGGGCGEAKQAAESDS